MKRATAQGFDPAALFEPDVIVGVQGQLRRRGPCDSERRLMAAILTSALEDMEKGRVLWNGVRPAVRYCRTTSPRRRRQDQQRYTAPRAYFESEDASYCFSFLNICDHLGLDPECVRRELRQKGLL